VNPAVEDLKESTNTQCLGSVVSLSLLLLILLLSRFACKKKRKICCYWSIGLLLINWVISPVWPLVWFMEMTNY